MYPEYSPTAGFGEVMPPYAWNGAIQNGQPIGGLKSLDMFCGAEWQDVDTILFVVVTQWVRWIDEYVEYIDALAPQIEEAGGRIVYVGAQNPSGRLLSSAATELLLNHFTPQRSGIRVGAGDSTSPTRLIDSGLVDHMPAAFVVRRADMKVVATQRTRRTNHLPYVEIAQDPNADWSDPGPPGIVPVLPSNCAEGDDEASEPNDTPDTAQRIQAGTLQGGICNRRGDFYNVNMRGEWALDLVFSHEVSDLEIALFNGVHRLRDHNGNFLGATSNDDNEYLEWRNPVLVYVYGHQGATAPYELTVRAR